MIFIGFLTGPAFVYAQDLSGRGVLSGIVISVADGSFLVNAKVTVSPGELMVGTNLDGIFEIELPAGKYDIRATQNGFLPYQIEGVEVKAGETTYQDIAIWLST